MNESAIDEFLENLDPNDNDQSPELIRTFLMASYKYAETVCQDARKHKSKLFKSYYQAIDGFHYRLNQRWVYPLNLFDAYVVLSLEWGGKRNHELRSSMSSSTENLVDVITRLHAQACQTALAISALLRKGYAGQAIALWRTIHELEITAALIADHGNTIAERYMQYQKVEYCKLAGQFRQHHEALGHEPFNDTEWQEIQQMKKDLKDTYGSPFCEEYGWAYPIFNKPRITFADIEKSVEKSHYRPYYKIASQATHASPMRIYHSVALLEGTDNIAAAGPSNSGLTLPAHASVVSLLHMNYLLSDKELPNPPDIESSGLLQTLYFLEKEIGKAFSNVQAEIESDHEKLGRTPLIGL